MPYLKADDSRAIAIHEEYQSTNDSKSFLKATREFLDSKASGADPPSEQKASSSPVPAPVPTSPWGAGAPSPSATSMLPEATAPSAAMLTPGTTTPVHTSRTPIQSPIRPPIGFPRQNESLTTTPNSHMSAAASHTNQHLLNLNHPLVPLTSSSNGSPIPPQYGNSGQANPSSFHLPSAMQQQQHHNNHHMPPPPPPPTPQQQQRAGSILPPPIGFPMNPHHHQQQQQQQQGSHMMMTMMMPPGHSQQQQQQQAQQQLYPLRQQSPLQQQPLNMMESLELQLDRLIGGDDSESRLLSSSSAPPTPSQLPPPGAIGTPRNNAVGSHSNGGHDPSTSFGTNLISASPRNNNGSMGGFNQLPPGSTPMSQQQQQQRQAQQLHHQQQLLQQRQAQSPANLMPHTPGSMMMATPGSMMTPTQPSPAVSEPTTTPRPPSSLALSQASTPGQLSPIMGPQPTPQPTTATKTPRKDFLQQKRMWTHIDEQPGRVTVNEINVSDPHVVLDVRPRKELKGRWMLSWKYLQQRAEEMAKKRIEKDDADSNDMNLQQPRLRSRDDNPMNRLLPNLRLGLFRRGCAENGAQASIISKSVMVSGGGGRPPYLDNQSQMVIGTVPFYSPRTPGHVVFRLYWDDEPLYTLGVGPTLHVRVMEDDYEGTIRFLLSNMKKKVNPTSLSSLHSLAQVLETPLQQQSRGGRQQQQSNDHRAGRATWGCICEARKVLDACAGEYAKTSQRLSKLATVVDELKAELEDEEEAKQQEENGGGKQAIVTSEEVGGKFDDAEEDASKTKTDDEQEKDDERVQALREKTRALMSGRASCERKWRDSQLAFASILKVWFFFPLSIRSCLLALIFVSNCTFCFFV